MMENLIDQLGISLESARLFEASQQQAERERLVGEITSRMRATLDLDAVLQTAARELRAALDLSEVEVRLGDFGSRRETGDGRAGGAETPRSSGQAEDGGQEGAEHA
jgi:GAF domain-containing protein